jgi:hypothetical protein
MGFPQNCGGNYRKIEFRAFHNLPSSIELTKWANGPLFHSSWWKSDPVVQRPASGHRIRMSGTRSAFLPLRTLSSISFSQHCMKNIRSFASNANMIAAWGDMQAGSNSMMAVKLLLPPFKSQPSTRRWLNSSPVQSRPVQPGNHPAVRSWPAGVVNWRTAPRSLSALATAANDSGHGMMRRHTWWHGSDRLMISRHRCEVEVSPPLKIIVLASFTYGETSACFHC